MSPSVIWIVSGDGNGAGKTTRARELAPVVFSFADAVRAECRRRYPDSQVNWFDKTAAGKVQLVAPGKTVRDCLIEVGQSLSAEDPLIWARAMEVNIRNCPNEVCAIDDLRKEVELDYIRKVFSHRLIHEHIIWKDAVVEPEFDNERLRILANRLYLRPEHKL